MRPETTQRVCLSFAEWGILRRCEQVCAIAMTLQYSLLQQRSSVSPPMVHALIFQFSPILCRCTTCLGPIFFPKFSRILDHSSQLLASFLTKSATYNNGQHLLYEPDNTTFWGRFTESLHRGMEETQQHGAEKGGVSDQARGGRQC